MTTNRERVLGAILDSPGLTDAELRVQTGVEPHQQVNQICRSLERDGLITRTPGSNGRIVNRARQASRGPIAPPLPAVRATEGHLAEEAKPRRWLRRRPKPAIPSSVRPAPADVVTLPPPATVLVLFPCSGRKAPGGGAIGGPSVLDILPKDLRKELVLARKSIAVAAQLDEGQLLPAWQRYSGTLYNNASTAISSAVQRNQAMITLSGGYGLVLPAEPIGIYDREFKVADWPRGLLPRCLVAIAEQLQKREVVAFCARTTGYADLVRSTPWQRSGVHARLVSPVLSTSGGAQVLVPKVLGKSLLKYLTDGVLPATVDQHSVAIEEVS